MEYKQFNLMGQSIYLAKDEAGITFVGGPLDTFEAMCQRFDEQVWIESDSGFESLETWLTDYTQGNHHEHAFEFNLKGTQFQKQVWNTLFAIPYGEVWTYTDVALAMGKPKAVRAVASAIGQNPILILVPCHRVNGKDGSLRGFRGGLDLKRRLQALESTDID